MATLTVVVQYMGHVINAGGLVSYRTVTLELTEEQQQKLQLKDDEHYSVVVLDTDLTHRQRKE